MVRHPSREGKAPSRPGPALYFGELLHGRDWINLRVADLPSLLRARPSLESWERIEDPTSPGVVVLAGPRPAV